MIIKKETEVKNEEAAIVKLMDVNTIAILWAAIMCNTTRLTSVGRKHKYPSLAFNFFSQCEYETLLFKSVSIVQK